MTKKYKKTFDNNISLNNKNFQEIIRFYLFECPVDKISHRGLKFSQYGWKGSPAFGKLKKEMLSVASSGNLKNNYHPCKKDELAFKFQEINNVFPCDEYCVFLKQSEKTVMQSLYSAIRNAFAHGSFRVNTYENTRMYYLQNYKRYKKAEIVLRESTLLNWIKIIKNGPNFLK